METIIKLKLTNTKVVTHHIYSTNVRSYSGLLQLNESLKICDVDYLRSKTLIKINKDNKKRFITVSHQSKFNMDFLIDKYEEFKFLRCAYCGRKDLVIFPFGVRGIKGVKREQMATADHILPIFLFPELSFDISNLAVACVKCNQKKGVKLIEPKFKTL